MASRYRPKKDRQSKNRMNTFLNNSYKKAEIEAEKRLNEIYQDVTQKYTLFMLYCLRNEYGWGNKRLMRVMEKIEFTAEALEEGYLTLEDIEKTLCEEVGIGAE